MATVAEHNQAPRAASQARPGLAPRRTFLPVYKPGDGTVTRLALFVVAAAFVLYTCHHWYYSWVSIRGFLLKEIFDPLGLSFLLNWSTATGPAKTVSWTGAMVLFALGIFLSYYYIYVHPKASEFLVQTDGELRKVTWPKVVPWFKPATQVWGSTYVVLLVVVFLALYVFAVDTVFNFLAQVVFYGD